MECISSALALTPCFFQPSYSKFHPILLKSSASVSAHYPSFAFTRCRRVPVCKSTQHAAAAAAVTDVGNAAAAEPSSVTSVAPKKVLVPIGYGTEEMEAVILVHVLRQAGAHVTLASVESQLEVEASSGLKLVADTFINSCTDVIYDLIALPGGMPGSVRLRDCEALRTITTKHAEEKRLYGAICAAPAVTLLPWGLLKRKETTCHPAFMDKLSSFWAVKSNIKVSGELTTSRGPGTAFEFALSLVGQLVGESVAQEVKSSLLLNTEDWIRKEEINEVEWLFDQLPQVLVPVANGCEEIEIVTIVDVLRRANVNVVIASVEKSREIVASQGTKIIADKLIELAVESTYDLIILPGGLKGSKQLSKSKVLKSLLKEQESGGRMYGAVSSSLALLEKHGLLKDKTIATGAPVSAKSTSKVVDNVKAVIDGKLITSKGLGTTVDFALAIVSKLFGHTRARSVAEGLVFEYPKR